jgi:hypothetical protein
VAENPKCVNLKSNTMVAAGANQFPQDAKPGTEPSGLAAKLLSQAGKAADVDELEQLEPIG